MEVLKKLDLFKVIRERIKKIIFCMVIVLSITIFSFTFSADEVVYLNKDINPFNFINNSGTYVAFGYSDNTNRYLSLMGSSSANYRITSLPYRPQSYYRNNYFYFQGVVFTYSGTDVDKRILASVDLGFEYYFDDFSLTMYVLVPAYGISFSGSYLSNGDLIPFNITSELVLQDTFINIYNNTDYITEDYYNFCLSNRYYTDESGSNTYFSVSTLNNTVCSLYKVSVNLTGLNKSPIEVIYFNYLYARSVSAIVRISPYFYFPDQTITGYIKSSQDQVYAQQLQNQQQIIAQQQEILNQLDNITGEPSSENEGTIDDIQTDYREKATELQDDIDIIHSVEFPTEVPTSVIPSSDIEYISEVIAPIFEDLSSLQIFNIIVPTGCVGFLVYIVLRRF